MLLSIIRIFFATLFGFAGVLCLLWAIEQHRDLKITDAYRQQHASQSTTLSGDNQSQTVVDGHQRSEMASINSGYLLAAVFLTGALFVLVVIDERDKVDEGKVFSSGKY